LGRLDLRQECGAASTLLTCSIYWLGCIDNDFGIRDTRTGEQGMQLWPKTVKGIILNVNKRLL
jgi:hypothetical protein